jgi:hypothetical protein
METHLPTPKEEILKEFDSEIQKLGNKADIQWARRFIEEHTNNYFNSFLIRLINIINLGMTRWKLTDILNKLKS